MDGRKISFSFFNFSMKAFGATVPLSRELLETCKKSARNAENRVGGEAGMGGPDGTVTPFDEVEPSETVRTSGDDGFLTFLARGLRDDGGGGVVE